MTLATDWYGPGPSRLPEQNEQSRPLPVGAMDRVAEQLMPRLVVSMSP